MKKIILTLAAGLILSVAAFTQTSDENLVPKKSQSELYNDFSVGYGGMSIFYFTGNVHHNYEYADGIPDYGYYDDSFNDPSSAGTFYFGFSRTLNHVVSANFMFAYQQLTTSGRSQYYLESGSTYYPVTTVDNLCTGLARFTFAYIDKSYVRMYSGVGIGFTLDFAKKTINGIEGTDRKIIPAGQLTIMGLRFGRAFGGFVEFGIGSIGIVNAGLSYKFGDE